MTVQSFFLDVSVAGGSAMNIVLFNSLALVVGASVLAILLKWLPIRSAAINQSLWLLVLLAGVVFFRVPIDVPSPFSGTSLFGERVFQRGNSSEGDGEAVASNGLEDEMPMVAVSDERDLKLDNSPNVEVANRSPSTSNQSAGLLVEAVEAGGVTEAPIVLEVENSPPHSVPQPSSQILSTNAGGDSAVSPPLEIADRPVNARRENSEVSLRDSWQVSRALFLVWISGGLLLVLGSVLRVWKFRRFVSGDEVSLADRSEVARWMSEWNAVCSDLKVRRIPRLCITKSIGPGLCPGITRPSLVLPLSLWEDLNGSQREAVLRHEAAHLVRHDLWRSLLARLLALPHWFNPFAWLAVRRFEEASEWACDDAATNSSIESGCQFAELLISLTKKNDFRPVVAGQPLATNRSLKERITRLVKHDELPHRSLWRTSVLLTVPCFVLAASIIDVRLVAQTEEPPREPTTVAHETSPASATTPDDHSSTNANSPQVKKNSEDKTPEPAERETSDTPASVDDATVKTAEETAAASTSSSTTYAPEPFPLLPGFGFSPWYELDENGLWQHIGWKVSLVYLPEDVDSFVQLMQSPHFKHAAIDLDNRAFSVIGLKRLKQLPNIEALHLRLNFTGVIPIGPGIGSIARLPRLRILDLSGHPVDDRAVATLAEFAPPLEQLRLYGTRITPKSLESLARLEHLEELDLGGLRRSDSTGERFRIFPLSNLKKLRSLRIAVTEIEAFRLPGSFSNLQTLHLENQRWPRLLAAEFELLSTLPKLRSLHLPRQDHTSFYPLPDKIALLKPLSTLRRLTISGYGSTREAERTREAVSKNLPLVEFGENYTNTLNDQTVVNFADTPLRDVLDYLSRQHELPIFVDKAALLTKDVDVEDIVDSYSANLVLSGVTLRSALRILLSEFDLEAVAHRDGVTVTTVAGNRLHRVHYDLSELLRDTQNGDKLAADLATVIKRQVTPELWGREFPMLPLSNKHIDETGLVKIIPAGTTLIVTAPPQTHGLLRPFIKQLTNGEHSQLFNVELRRMIDTRHSELSVGNNPDAKLFVNVPLIDCLSYLRRIYKFNVVIDAISMQKAGVTTKTLVTRDFKLTTLEDALDRILEPLKLTWVYEDDVIKIVSQKSADARSRIVVHQLSDDFLIPTDSLKKDDWLRTIEALCIEGLGTTEPQYEVWFNRVIVHAPWRDQYRLSRKLDELLYRPNRIRRRRNSPEEAN